MTQPNWPTACEPRSTKRPLRKTNNQPGGLDVPQGLHYRDRSGLRDDRLGRRPVRVARARAVERADGTWAVETASQRGSYTERSRERKRAPIRWRPILRKSPQEANCSGKNAKPATLMRAAEKRKSVRANIRGRRHCVATVTSMSDGEIFYHIRNGIRNTGMPAWQMPDRQIWQLVAFIRHLPRVAPLAPKQAASGQRSRRQPGLCGLGGLPKMSR